LIFYNKNYFLQVINSGKIKVIKKETKKFIKYKDNTINFQLILNVKTKPIYLILNLTGSILVLLKEMLIIIPRKHPEDL
jgi:hypothetical protein